MAAVRSHMSSGGDNHASDFPRGHVVVIVVARSSRYLIIILALARASRQRNYHDRDIFDFCSLSLSLYLYVKFRQVDQNTGGPDFVGSRWKNGGSLA